MNRPLATDRRSWWLLLASLGVSRLVDNLVGVAAVVLVVQQSRSTGVVALVTAARLAPLVLLSTFAIVLALPRPRSLLRVSAGVRACLALVMAVVGSTSLRGLVLLAVAVALVGAPVKFAAGSLVVHSVREREFAAASATYQSMDHLSFLAAPAVSGVLLLLVTPTTGFVVASGLSVLLAVSVGQLAGRPPTPARVNPFGRIASGLRLVVAVRDARLLMAVRAVTRFSFGFLAVVVALLPKDLGLKAAELGFFQAALGAGGFASVLLLRRRVSHLRPDVAIGVAVLLLAAGVATVGTATSRTVALPLLVLVGAADLAIHLVCSLALQRTLPTATSAAATAAVDSLTAAGLLAGSLLTPLLVNTFGARSASLYISGVLLLLFLVSLPGLATLSGRTRARGKRVDDLVGLLAASDLLDRASAGTLQLLADSGTRVPVKRGSLVVREGELADAVYVLVRGRLGVHVTGEEAARTGRMPELVRGALFGEVGVVTGRRRTASVLALEDSDVVRIPAADFVSVVAMDFEAGDAVGQQVEQSLSRSHH